MDETTYHFVIIVATVASCLSIQTALIYTWVCCKTRPLKLPTIALTSLMWLFSAILTWRLYVVMIHDCLDYDYPWVTGMTIVTIAGYCFFLVGTFKDATVIPHPELPEIEE